MGKQGLDMKSNYIKLQDSMLLKHCFSSLAVHQNHPGCQPKAPEASRIRIFRSGGWRGGPNTFMCFKNPPVRVENCSCRITHFTRTMNAIEVKAGQGGRECSGALWGLKRTWVHGKGLAKRRGGGEKHLRTSRKETGSWEERGAFGANEWPVLTGELWEAGRGGGGCSQNRASSELVRGAHFLK